MILETKVRQMHLDGIPIHEIAVTNKLDHAKVRMILGISQVRELSTGASEALKSIRKLEQQLIDGTYDGTLAGGLGAMMVQTETLLRLTQI